MTRTLDLCLHLGIWHITCDIGCIQFYQYFSLTLQTKFVHPYIFF